MEAGAVEGCGTVGPFSESLSVLSLSLLILDSVLLLIGFITCSINSNKIGCNFISVGSDSISTENNRNPFLLGGGGDGESLKLTLFGLPILLSLVEMRSSDTKVE